MAKVLKDSLVSATLKNKYNNIIMELIFLPILAVGELKRN